MRRWMILLAAALLTVLFCGCVAGDETAQASATPAPTQTAAITPAPVQTAVATVAQSVSVTEPDALTLPEAAEGWADSYVTFLDENYDVFAALWPEGMTGVGFIDLDLDGTPEMVVFDQGASATLGVQLFDLVDGTVCCVSSVLDSAAGAFGDTYFSSVTICASYFEAFRLSYTQEAGWCFWVDSANGTLDSAWNEIVRFDCVDGVLTPVSVCTRYLQSDEDTGLVVAEEYTVAGAEAQAADYEAAAALYLDGVDVGYEAAGVFLWSDMDTYDTTYEGFLALANAAVAAYEPIGELDMTAS